jgi:Rrf2 family protein
MRLSTRSRYGLRAAIRIARRKDAFTTCELIAGEEEVSKKYLDAILADLRGAGILEAVRGVKGGYSLARPPSEISAAEVVEALEGPIALVPCVEEASICRRASQCPTRGVWCMASQAVREALSGLMLAELAKGTASGT